MQNQKVQQTIKKMFLAFQIIASELVVVNYTYYYDNISKYFKNYFKTIVTLQQKKQLKV